MLKPFSTCNCDVFAAMSIGSIGFCLFLLQTDVIIGLYSQLNNQKKWIDSIFVLFFKAILIFTVFEIRCFLMHQLWIMP